MRSVMEHDAATAIRQLLQNYKASTIQLNRPIVSICSSMSIVDAFNTLSENKILSAPVYEKDSNNFVGFLDTRDLLAFCVFASDEKNLSPSLDELITIGAKRVPVAITAITPSYLARRHRFAVVSESDNLVRVVEKLACNDVHRVPVVDAKGDLSSIITQSSIVKFLHDHDDAMEEALVHTVKDLELGSSSVVTVNKDTPALTAFNLMDTKGLSGIGIVDDDGKLIANTSASDIQLFLDSMESLSLPIIQFQRNVWKSTDTKAPLVCVRPDTALAEVLSRMHAAHIHRVFVVDVDSRPLSVISVTDIMRFISAAT